MSAARPWRYVAASVTGSSHVAAGIVCQDAHRVLLTKSGAEDVLVLAVSDGAGTARLADVGSRLAVNAICEQAAAWFASGRAVADIDRDTIIDWLNGVREQIAEHSSQCESAMRDFAATLLFAVLGENHAAFAQLGDGAIVVGSSDVAWTPVFWPQRGEYANTTFFVTEDNACDTIVSETVEGKIDEVVVFSDGLEQLVLDLKSKAAHQAFFSKMVQPVRASQARGADDKLAAFLVAYLTSPAITGRSDDDLTLVIASRL